MNDNNSLWQIVTEQDHKFEYSFTTLCFAILGLSIQFSPNYGRTWALLLVAGWSLLLISALLAGYRIVYRLVILKINYQINRNENYRTQAEKIINVKKVDPYRKVERPDGSAQSMEELKEQLNEAIKNVAEGDAAFTKIEKRLSVLYWVQMGAFLGGLICNFVFVSANYLSGGF